MILKTQLFKLTNIRELYEVILIKLQSMYTINRIYHTKNIQEIV